MPKHIDLKHGTTIVCRKKPGGMLQLVVYGPDEGERTYEQCLRGDIANKAPVNDTGGDRDQRASDP